MKMKFRAVSALAVVMSLVLAGCSSASAASDSRDTSSATKDKTIGYQLEMPADGEEVAVMETSMGTVKIRLFPEGAPKTVENFKNLAKNGYYDGLTFHRVIKDFMVQGGDPTATGAGGEAADGKAFQDEFNDKLLNLRGSLSMANSGYDTNGSQFFINQAGPVNTAMWSSFEGLYKELQTYDKKTEWPQIAQQQYTILNTELMNDEYKKLYEKQGGNPSLDGWYNAFEPKRGHTVFGQVFEGMEIVDQIAAVSTDDSDKPVSDVTMTSVKIEKYKAS